MRIATPVQMGHNREYYRKVTIWREMCEVRNVHTYMILEQLQNRMGFRIQMWFHSMHIPIFPLTEETTIPFFENMIDDIIMAIPTQSSMPYRSSEWNWWLPSLLWPRQSPPHLWSPAREEPQTHASLPPSTESPPFPASWRWDHPPPSSWMRSRVCLC